MGPKSPCDLEYESWMDGASGGYRFGKAHDHGLPWSLVTSSPPWEPLPGALRLIEPVEHGGSSAYRVGEQMPIRGAGDVGVRVPYVVGDDLKVHTGLGHL